MIEERVRLGHAGWRIHLFNPRSLSRVRVTRERTGLRDEFLILIALCACHLSVAMEQRERYGGWFKWQLSRPINCIIRSVPPLHLSREKRLVAPICILRKWYCRGDEKGWGNKGDRGGHRKEIPVKSTYWWERMEIEITILLIIFLQILPFRSKSKWNARFLHEKQVNVNSGVVERAVQVSISPKRHLDWK